MKLARCSVSPASGLVRVGKIKGLSFIVTTSPQFLLIVLEAGQGGYPPQDDDARRRRVHAALPAACVANGFPALTARPNGMHEGGVDNGA